MLLPNETSRRAALAPDGLRPLLMRQRWARLLFLHWAMPAERIQGTLPAGLTVDTYEGAAYLAVVPFFMERVRPVGLPTVPWLSNFLELNVRTYVHDAQGVPGVWFYSLDCSQPVAVQLAQKFMGLPYRDAAMSARVEGGWVDYESRRRGAQETARFRYRGVGEAREAGPGTLEFFLLERYYLYARRWRRLVRGQVAHARYRYRPAEVPEWSLVPAALDGFAELAGPPAHLCVAEDLEVEIYGTKVLPK